MVLESFRDALVQGAKLPIVKQALRESGILLMQIHYPERQGFKPIRYVLTPEKHFLHKRKNSTAFIYREDIGFLSREQLISLCEQRPLTYYHNSNDPKMDYWESLIA